MEKKHAKTSKEKRRNMEKRKEKSRDAARCRRGRETEIFTDLSALLPIPAAKVAHLDKASVIRVAISYLKIRAVIQSIPSKENCHTEIEDCNTDSLFVDSLEGFLLVTSTDGDIVFISENVNRYLGLEQVEVLGQSIYELSHPCDHAEIKEMLSTKDANVQKSYFLRMKWSPKGRSVNINKATQYKVIQYTGRVIESKTKIGSEDGACMNGASNKSQPIVANTPAYHFVAIGEAIWHPANIEVPLGRNTFLSKHSLDMKYTYADERIVDFFGYQPEALIKKSIYDYHHAQDTVVIKNCFKNLFEKGQSQTERYRFLAQGGGYAWVVTQSTLIYNTNQKPLSVVCVNFIISGIENKNEIYSLCQLDDSRASLTSADSYEVRDNAAVTVTASATDASYLYENSPQQLIEKLRINPTPTSPFAAAESPFQERYSASVSAIDSHHESPPPVCDFDSADVILSSLPGLDIVELLSTSSSSSASPLSHNSPTSQDTLNDYWLMSDGQKDAFYDITVLPDTSGGDSSAANSDGDDVAALQTHVKLENAVRTNEPNDNSVKVSDIPKPTTVDVFVPYTEEMNKGFLSLAEDDTGLMMLKEEPEDLTHLAPTAGGICVPLDEGPVDYVLPEDNMFSEVMLSDCNLLSNDADRDLSSSSPISFFSCRDDLDPSSRPLSPILAQNQDCSIPSFCSDDSSLNDNTVNHFLDFGLMHGADDIDDLSGKSPYISMSLEDDHLIPFVTNDFMWGSSSGESSAWSSVPSSPTSNCSLSPRLDHTSSLAKLLKAEPICNYDGGGSDRNDANGGGGATKHSFGNNVNSLADRNYSNVGGNFKTVAYQRTVETSKRRSNASIKKEANTNHRSEDKRKTTSTSLVTVGSKRSISDSNWGRGSANSCKRSKQTSRTIIINGTGGGGGGGGGHNRRIHAETTAAMAEAASTAKQTNSVLMNLLVSGCDLSAGYDEDSKDGSRRGGVAVYNGSNATANRIDYEIKNNDGVHVSNSKCWSPFKRKSVSLFRSEASQIPSLMDLTEQDYAVNAPSVGELLQGSELLRALECATII